MFLDTSHWFVYLSSIVHFLHIYIRVSSKNRNANVINLSLGSCDKTQLSNYKTCSIQGTSTTPLQIDSTLLMQCVSQRLGNNQWNLWTQNSMLFRVRSCFYFKEDLCDYSQVFSSAVIQDSNTNGFVFEINSKSIISM